MTTDNSIGINDNSSLYRGICRLVDISMLASFMRDFPLNNLSEEERGEILRFESYMTELENDAFFALGIY